MSRSKSQPVKSRTQSSPSLGPSEASSRPVHPSNSFMLSSALPEHLRPAPLERINNPTIGYLTGERRQGIRIAHAATVPNEHPSQRAIAPWDRSYCVQSPESLKAVATSSSSSPFNLDPKVEATEMEEEDSRILLPPFGSNSAHLSPKIGFNSNEPKGLSHQERADPKTIPDTVLDIAPPNDGSSGGSESDNESDSTPSKEHDTQGTDVHQQSSHHRPLQEQVRRHHQPTNTQRAHHTASETPFHNPMRNLTHRTRPLEHSYHHRKWKKKPHLAPAQASTACYNGDFDPDEVNYWRRITRRNDDDDDTSTLAGSTSDHDSRTSGSESDIFTQPTRGSSAVQGPSEGPLRRIWQRRRSSQEAQHAQQAQQGHYPTSPDGAILESGTAPPQLIEWARQLGLAKGPQVKSDGVGGLRTTEEGLSAQGEADEEDSNKVVERTPTKVELDEAVSPPDAESKSIGENLSEYDREMDAMEPTANGYQLRKSHCKQRRLTRRRKIYLFFEKPRSVPAKIFAAVSILCILISVALTLIQSLPWFDATTWIYYYSVWLPLDCAVTAVFMIDYVCRLYGADNRWKFIIQPMNIIDLITIVPFYITLAVPWESQYAIRAIRILRLFRIFRIFQFSKYSVGLHITTRVFLHSIEQLLLVSVYLLIVLLISSTLMFYAERGEFNNGDWQWYRWNPNSSQWEVSPYQSIIHSLYWSVVTVTTTGYGDIVPFTVVGRLIAGITMICGILTIALPTSIVGSNFTNEWQLWRRIQTQNKIKEAQKATQGNADMIKGALRKMSKRDKIKVLEDQNLSMLEVVAEMQDRLSELNPPRYYHKYKIEQAAHTETKRKLQEVENELAKLRKAHQNLAKFNSLFRGHHSSQDNEDSLTLTKTNESSNTTMGSSRLSKLFSRHTHNTDKDEPQSKSPFPTLSRTLTGDSKDSETNFSERVREKSSSIANTVKHGWKIASHKDNPSPQRAMTEPVTAIPDNDDDSSAPLLQQSTIHHDSPSSSLSANQGRTSSLPTYVEEPRYDEGEHDKPGRPEVAPEPSHHCQSGTEPTDTIPGQSAATRFQALFSDPADSVSSHEDPVGTGVQHPLRDNMLAPNQSTTSLSSSSHIGSRVSTPDGYVAPYMMTDMISREPERTHHYEGN